MADDRFYCWPDWMPKPQRNGYGYDVTDRRSRTDMEVGSLIRVNYDTDETTLDCTLVCNAVQSQWFEKFERCMLSQGSQWFQMPIMIAGCIEMHTVRFASRPKAGSIIGPYYTSYQLRLDVQERDLKLCQQLMDFMLCVSPKHIIGTSDNAQRFWLGLKCWRIPFWFCEQYIEVAYCIFPDSIIDVSDSAYNFWVSLQNLQIPSWFK